MITSLMNQLGLALCFFFSSRRRHTRLQGDWSSDVCSSDLHQQTAAMTNSAITSASRTRTAAKAGARPPPPVRRSCAGALIGSGGPGELGGGEPGLALVLDAERVDPRTPSLGHRQVRPGRMEHAVEPDRPTVLLTERHNVLDLELDHIPDADAVQQPVVTDFDGRPLDTDDLAHEGSEHSHRAAELPAEDLDQLVEL